MGGKAIVNGREIELSDGQTSVRGLRERAGIDPGRALAEVVDAGTMRQLRDDEVLPATGGVYTSIPQFGYGS